jgi:hypothetical protein
MMLAIGGTTLSRATNYLTVRLVLCYFFIPLINADFHGFQRESAVFWICVNLRENKMNFLKQCTKILQK